jgi:hypothetical protein
MKHLFQHFIILFLIASSISCNNDNPTPAKTLKGDAFGYLIFYSQSGNKIDIPAGFKLSVNNKSNNLPVPVAVDEHGKFALQSISMGEYEIEPSLAGYKNVKMPYYHVGGDAPGFIGNINMLEISRNNVELISYSYVNNYGYDDLIIKGKIIKDEMYDGNNYKIRLVFGNDENISSNSYQFTYQAYVSGLDFEINVPYFAYYYNFKYVRAYSDNLVGNCEYLNYSTNSNCTFTTIGPSSNLLSLE